MDWAAHCLECCRTVGVVLDTNVFVLWLVGSLDMSMIPEVDETADCDADDFRRLRNAISLAPRFSVNAAILAETSNILEAANRKSGAGIFGCLREQIRSLNEIHSPAAAVVGHEIFTRLGFADASIYDMALGGALVVTKDGDLTGWLMNAGLPVLNLNHLRSADWLV